MSKVFVFLGCKQGETTDEFVARYMSDHKEKILSAGVTRYLANVVEEPSEELLNAGWGVFALDGNEIVAFDEVVTDDVDRLMAQYEGEKLIHVYRTDEFVIRPCVVDTPKGEQTIWLKRVTLIRRKEGITREECHKHWQGVHGPLGLIHLTGAGLYVQNNIVETLVGEDYWDGVTELQYWNVNAFKYGHFSRGQESKDVMLDDCKKFLGPGLTLLVREYVQL